MMAAMASSGPAPPSVISPSSTSAELVCVLMPLLVRTRGGACMGADKAGGAISVRPQGAWAESVHPKEGVGNGKPNRAVTMFKDAMHCLAGICSRSPWLQHQQPQPHRLGKGSVSWVVGELVRTSTAERVRRWYPDPGLSTGVRSPSLYLGGGRKSSCWW